MFRSAILLFSLACAIPAAVKAQPCGTFFVDSNTPAGNFSRAIQDVNSLGCPSGGLNTIVIDTGPGSFGDTVVGAPLPTLQRPTEIRLSSPGSEVRHVIRSNNGGQTQVSFALRASARMVVNDLDVVGGSGRDFLGGIQLLGNADNSQIRGVRVDNVRRQGIQAQDVDGLEIRRSSHNPVEIYSSGWGINHANPQFESAIQISNAINTTIYGTFLGVRPDGSSSGNCTYGIEIHNATGVFIGAALANINLRNHIGGQRWGGIRVHGSSLVNIRGNYLGLAANGQTLVGNGGASCFGSPPALPQGGVVVTASNAVLIGGGEGEGNVLVANSQGVIINGSHTVTLRRNLIGQRPSGQSGLNAGDAIRLENGAGSSGVVLIGGSSEQANVIRGGPAGGWGVSLLDGVGRVDVRRNAIWGHAHGGIGRNGAPSPPGLSIASADTGQVAGTMTPLPDAGEIDFYVDDGDQGRWFMGTLAVPANTGSFNTVLAASPEFVAGRNITATFTRLAGSGAGTSGFSAALPIGGDDRIFTSGFEEP